MNIGDPYQSSDRGYHCTRCGNWEAATLGAWCQQCRELSKKADESAKTETPKQENEQ